MFSARHNTLAVAVWVSLSLLLFACLAQTAQAQNAKYSTETTNMTVVVQEADTGTPISQAHISLQFSEPHGPTIPNRKAKQITYGAKTDAQGRCKFAGINKGPIVLTITAPAHQTYGKELQLEKDNQVFEIKLKKPQPLI